jgi:hypothetical protein
MALRGQAEADWLIAQGANAGYDLSGLRPTLESLISQSR